MNQAADQMLVSLLRETIVALVRDEDTDLTARQLAVLLTCYTVPGEHTVRSLAAHLDVSKPAVTRALDRLSEFALVRRQPDERDRRSVLVQQTARGAAYLRRLRETMSKGRAELERVQRGAGPVRARRTARA
jgi:DNA-binding MarR family transcriptional regulator